MIHKYNIIFYLCSLKSGIMSEKSVKSEKVKADGRKTPVEEPKPRQTEDLKGWGRELKKWSEKGESWWQIFTGKQKFSISDSDSGTERWYMFISPLRVTIGLTSLIVLMFILVVLTVAYTPVMDTIPGYPGGRSREMLVRSIMRLDSLERQMANLTVYSDNIALIMEGKTPVIRDVSRVGDSIEIQKNKAKVPPGAADSILRARMEGTGEYSLAGSSAAALSSIKRSDFVAPAQGLIGTRFSPVNGRYGIEIVTKANNPVVAVREGSIMLSLWTPENGNVVAIQHADNLISVYRNISQLKGGVGTRVKMNEIIGVAGASGEEGAVSGPLEFELWFNGTPVDPENYIVF